MTMSKTYFPNLDGLRTLAIIPVFWVHTLGFPQPQANITNYFWVFGVKIIPSAHLGVVLFFVISGFLISYLLFEEKEQKGSISIINFYKRRVLRIWPLYFFVLFMGFILLPYLNKLLIEDAPFSSKNIPYDNLWQYFLFLANYDLIANHQTTPILTVLWSVSIEEQFYLFWPILIKFFNKKQLGLLFLSIIIASLLWRWKFSDSINYYYYHTFSCIFDLCMGATVAYLVFYYHSFAKRIQELNKLIIWLVYLLGIGGMYLPHILKLGGYKIIVDCATVCFFAFVVLEQNFAKNSIFKVGQSRTLSSLGKYTYSFYCLHLIAIFIFVGTLKFFKLEVLPKTTFSLVIQLVGSLGVTFVFSYISYHYIERPFLRLKNRMY
jgi:peptidoglycan/LPS O-acetylase OafA/YrhL